MTRCSGHDSQRGQSLVETALIVPVLLLIFMGLFDFGRAIFAYNSVSEAARNGARVAIVNQTPADICRVAAERATGLGMPTTCAPNVTAVGVWHVDFCTTSMEINCAQSVRVNYQFQAITPLIGAFIGPIALTSTSQVNVESACPPIEPGETACPIP
jgi:Flp pilus assembly protein TadG